MITILLVAVSTAQISSLVIINDDLGNNVYAIHSIGERQYRMEADGTDSTPMNSQLSNPGFEIAQAPTAQQGPPLSPPGPPFQPPNNRPIANAGPDQIVMPSTPVTLDGSGSFDPDGDPLTYSWTQTEGPSVTLSDSTAVSPTFNAPSDVEHVRFTFVLAVNDGQQDSLLDAVVIEVLGVA